MYEDFKWRLSAYVAIQDIFDSPILENMDDPLSMFHIWYFYYESKYILIESILSGFYGLYLSSEVLSRLFIEFNILQNYFYRRITLENNFIALKKYFQNNVLPSWNTVINGSLPNDNFCKPIKIRLDQHLKALSKNSAHPYHPQFSPKQGTSFIPTHTLDGLFFWHGLSISLQAVLWMYYVNFPMLFHKVDILKKFGFNPPVGLFADEQCVHEIKKTLTKDEFRDFKSYSDKHTHVKNMLDWVNSFEDLTEKKILETWNNDDGKISSILEGNLKQIAKMRAMKEMMALKRDKMKLPDLSYEKITQILNYNEWKKIYKKITK